MFGDWDWDCEEFNCCWYCCWSLWSVVEERERCGGVGAVRRVLLIWQVEMDEKVAETGRKEELLKAQGTNKDEEEWERLGGTGVAFMKEGVAGRGDGRGGAGGRRVQADRERGHALVSRSGVGLRWGTARPGANLIHGACSRTLATPCATATPADATHGLPCFSCTSKKTKGCTEV